MRKVVLTVVTIALLVLCTAAGVPASGFSGAWKGTFNSQPTELLPDGSYPENVNQFELLLHEKSGIVTGEIRRTKGGSLGPAQPIRNGKVFGTRACFDVVTQDEDMRWCVSVRGDRLTGTWSGGPEGGPLLDGAGVGARLLKISADRIQNNFRSGTKERQK